MMMMMMMMMMIAIRCETITLFLTVCYSHLDDEPVVFFSSCCMNFSRMGLK